MNNKLFRLFHIQGSQKVGFISIIKQNNWIVKLVAGSRIEKFKITCLLFDVGFRLFDCLACPHGVTWYYGLYFPNWMPHFGQEWVVSFMSSMQKGIRQQGQHPTRQRINAVIMPHELVSLSVMVVTVALHLLQFTFTGCGPKWVDMILKL